jgi:hypothetical protein
MIWDYLKRATKSCGTAFTRRLWDLRCAKYCSPSMQYGFEFTEIIDETTRENLLYVRHKSGVKLFKCLISDSLQ